MLPSRVVVALLLSLLLGACGGLPRQAERAPSKAGPPSPDSPLAQVARASSPGPARHWLSADAARLVLTRCSDKARQQGTVFARRPVLHPG